MSNKSITILFPGVGSTPGGGYKVAYEYANRLARDNYDVNIAYPDVLFFRRQPIKNKIKAVLRYLYYRFYKSFSCRSWFSLDNQIQEHFIYSLNYRHVPKTDIYIATSVETAIYLNTYDNIPNSNKIYLIQDYENWKVSDECVRNTYKYGFKNVVISNWLAEIVAEVGGDYHLIKNGFDFDYFKMTIPICNKDKYCISMIYRTYERKGTKYGLQALAIVKKQYPRLRVKLFGTCPRPEGVPDYIEYYRKPDRETHNRIYNESAIYLAPSIDEGWGLPVGEAMICGCAVVCTDNKGFREMAEHEVTALMSPVCDAESLANNIMRLIENDDLRISIAENGNANIRKFDWEDSYERLNTIIVQ